MQYTVPGVGLVTSLIISHEKKKEQEARIANLEKQNGEKQQQINYLNKKTG